MSQQCLQIMFLVIIVFRNTSAGYTLLLYFTKRSGGEVERDDDTVVSDCHMEGLLLLVTFVELLNRALWNKGARNIKYQIQNTPLNHKEILLTFKV